MERLTEENQIGPFAALKDKAEAVPGAFGTYDCLYAHMVAVTRLKAYEDTGLEPKEIKELCTDEVTEIAKLFRHMIEDGAIDHFQELLNAEKDGRLVVLPCKVGDMLYEVDLPEYGVIACKVLHIDAYNGPMAHVPGGPMVSAISIGVEVVEGHGKGSSYAFETSDFGKLVFLTREEAEAALKKKEDEQHEN